MRSVVERPAAATAMLRAVLVITPIAAVASTAPFVVGAAGLCLALIIAMLWRGENPPILLLPALFQWSEVATVPISTIWLRLPLEALSPYGADLYQSAIYGLCGVTALAGGMFLGLGRSPPGVPFAERLRANAMAWPFQDVLRLTLAAMAGGYALSAASIFAGPARELLNNAGNIRYAGLFALTYWCILQKKHYGALALVVAFEVVSGMTGFFANFKDSLLVLVVAAMAARLRLRLGNVLAILAPVALLLVVAIFWSAVKPDYRNFVNQGTGAQMVLVPLGDRIGFLYDSLFTFDFGDGFNRLVSRHGYIEFLALVMQNVPINVPHENGNLTWAVLQHITMPRILFPDKPPLPSDTEVMARYAGLDYTWDGSTSISIGYLGELYIDFGWIGGLIAAFAIGVLVGTAYRLVSRRNGLPELLVAGLCVTVALPVAYFGTAYAKLMGAFVFSAALAFVWKYRGIPFALPVILGRSRRAPVPRQPQIRRY